MIKYGVGLCRYLLRPNSKWRACMSQGSSVSLLRWSRASSYSMNFLKKCWCGASRRCRLADFVLAGMNTVKTPSSASGNPRGSTRWMAPE
ncbi:hypothetical protein BT96DRAFT_450824 [Gymnopus androsaceus JB14]|uniref:Uncharacterized protein n=1 Tax=Gymnopus androsaceus JB14 TaxID=1447944 RepID=A0A6A4GS51_9AGAR|nr:hypothetical protein BT96DRAFT_450824 [Gymnopus androsaceus JB14]